MLLKARQLESLKVNMSESSLSINQVSSNSRLHDEFSQTSWDPMFSSGLSGRNQ